MNPIGEACRKLGTWDLSGCVMLFSVECSPICSSIAFWANIRGPKQEKELRMEQILQDEAQAVRQEFRGLPDAAPD